nr:hypothetical protein CFP56_10403 [Quercus suber]
MSSQQLRPTAPSRRPDRSPPPARCDLNACEAFRFETRPGAWPRNARLDLGESLATDHRNLATVGISTSTKMLRTSQKAFGRSRITEYCIGYLPKVKIQHASLPTPFLTPASNNKPSSNGRGLGRLRNKAEAGSRRDISDIVSCCPAGEKKPRR